jgi:hypothetical protein
VQLQPFEGEYDLRLRDSGRYQLTGDSVLRTIPLDPELATDQIYVDQATVDSLAGIPSDVHEQLAVSNTIEYRLGLEFS